MDKEEVFSFENSVDSENADSENVDFENVDSENVDSENVDSENADSENADSENADSENADSENADSENADSENADSENADSENADSENADSENADSENADSENADSENADSENADSENADSENADSENADSENADSENADSENADSENADSENADSENADSENADSENADSENADSENADSENADSENADSENADSENADSENADSENADSENADSENADSENADFVLPLNEVVEAVLFAANEPLGVDKIAKAAGKRIRRDAVLEAVKELQRNYIETSRAFEIVEIAEKFQMMTRAEFAPNIQALYGKKAIKEEKEKKMSPAVLDTLAIIAYKQPVTRAEVEAVRGVGCGQIMRQLMERGSIKPVGKKMDVIGYPLLYGTTDEFLNEFGLASLDVLPMAGELRRLTKVDLPKPEVLAGESNDNEPVIVGDDGSQEVHSKLEDAVVLAGGEGTEKNSDPVKLKKMIWLREKITKKL